MEGGSTQVPVSIAGFGDLLDELLVGRAGGGEFLVERGQEFLNARSASDSLPAQAKSLDVLMKRIAEAITLCLASPTRLSR